jgi:hypothetical protein
MLPIRKRNLRLQRISTLWQSACRQKRMQSFTAIVQHVSTLHHSLPHSPHYTVDGESVGIRSRHADWAAGYMNMLPPKLESVVKDCDSALALDKKYIKALNRRANALEKLGRNEEALHGKSLSWPLILLAHININPDFTASTILQGFRDTSSAQSVERVLHTLATVKAEETVTVSSCRKAQSSY